MIDIIIPCYNSHDTIDKTICSIIPQQVPFKITLVNDNGKPYDDIINRYNFIPIEQINCKENKGPGNARNVGINNTNNPYILFIDSDDLLINPFALSTMLNYFNDDTSLIVSNILKENIDHTTKIIKRNTNYTHGKLYKRSLLDKYNIRFNESYCCEDASFNLLYNIYSYIDKKNLKWIDETFYAWMYNSKSLGRKNVDEWEHCTVMKGTVDNYIWAFSKLEKYSSNAKILEYKINGMIHVILNWLHNTTFYPQYKKENDECLRLYYSKIYKNIYVPDDLFNCVYDLFNIQGNKAENINQLKIILKILGDE